MRGLGLSRPEQLPQSLNSQKPVEALTPSGFARGIARVLSVLGAWGLAPTPPGFRGRG